MEQVDQQREHDQTQANIVSMLEELYNEVGNLDSEQNNQNVTINPEKIRFSQSSVNGSQAIIDSMKVYGWAGDPIDVVLMPDGVYTTIDNTRISAARVAGINVKANIHAYDEPLPSEWVERFTTKQGQPTTWGEAVELRIRNQKSSFKKENPYGSFNLEDIH